jgi:hypothetical protein
MEATGREESEESSVHRYSRRKCVSDRAIPQVTTEDERQKCIGRGRGDTKYHRVQQRAMRLLRYLTTKGLH